MLNALSAIDEDWKACGVFIAHQSMSHMNIRFCIVLQNK